MNFWSIIFWGPLVVYWVANIIASIKIKDREKANLFLPLMFWILHVLVGFGFFYGILFGKNSAAPNSNSKLPALEILKMGSCFTLRKCQ